MKPLSVLVCLTTAFCWIASARAQTALASFPLWTDGAPGALGTTTNDIPTLTVYLPKPELATGAAMIICPGGGYVGLAAHEGGLYARWLNDLGITGLVLKYRLGPAYHHPAMLQDASRAIRIARARAEEWKIDPNRVGIMGSSAGGHLASTVLTHYDAGNTNSADPIERQSSRPDLGILCYAVITMGEFTHGGSRSALLGRNPSPDLVQDLSNELRVTKDTPPCFLWATADDRTVPVENSIAFASALRKARVPVELHIYEHGSHGLGLGTHDYDPSKWLPWTVECASWLKTHKFAN